MGLEESKKGYWNSKENRMKSLLNYIKENNSLKSIMSNPTGKKLYHNFHKHGDNLRNSVIELGLDPDTLGLISKSGYYNDFEKIKIKIELFIQENFRFPTKKEIEKKLKIDQRFIDKFGGIYEVRRLMNYSDENDLVDDNNYVNDSLMEFYVSQYLIHRGICCDRNKVIPNKENKKYRYDFYIEKFNLYIELWGYEKGNKSEINEAYNKKRRLKEELYKKNSHNLISIEGSLINTYDIPSTVRRLNEIFEEFIDTSSNLSEDIFISSKTISDDYLLGLLRPLKSNKGNLPTLKEIDIADLGYVIRIIRKRHGNYYNFAKKYGEILSHKKIDKGEITRDFIYDIFDKITEASKEVSRLTLKKHSKHHFALSEWISQNGNLVEVKLDYYSQYVRNNRRLPNDCIYFLCSVSLNFGVNIHNNVSEEQIKKAKNIINSLLIDPSQVHFINSTFFEIRNKQGWSEQEYFNFFNIYANEGYKLTPSGLQMSSPIGYASFMKKFEKTDWVSLVRHMGKFDHYDNYIFTEYKNYLLSTGEHNISSFVRVHPYIRSVDLMGYLTRKQWNERLGILVKNKRYNEADLENNFFEVKYSLERIPLYKEFEELTKIPLTTYSSKLKLRGKVYDLIVKKYSSSSEYEKYMSDKLAHKKSVGATNAAMAPPKISDSELKDNFIVSFNECMQVSGKYPTRRNFKEYSKIDESTYRSRLKLSWLEVVKFYGFK